LGARVPGIEIVATLSQQLSWSHFIALLPLKSDEAFMFYGQDAASRNLGVRDLRKLISRKAYERQEIANYQLSESSGVPLNAFKDPYLLDVYGLKDNYLEADLEKAILTELERFILENGRGFTYAGKQVHMTMDGDTHKLDMLFYNRVLKRLVAIDLKIGKFKPEYWTHLPPKLEFERKISQIYEEAKERLERRKLIATDIKRDIDYFYELKTEDADVEDEEFYRNKNK
jgi:predicted nuclease of restriction endonuclease-like (RecB) superfamily